MSTVDYTAAPRAVDVLPAKVGRRLTRRDGLLPLVFTLELLTGVAFGLASHSGDSRAAVAPARPQFAPVAQVSVLPPPAAASVQAPPTRRHAPVNPFGPQVPSAS